ncbi:MULTISPECIES: iron-containing redox enzyme family protein [Thermomonosporaceae]|uniref:iron-containing redox enzyme family protein n=1 Tax=Thermomonosporaceae TaxID=2012 RepID=UPI00255AB4A2|nr:MULTISPECIES: iron-containing redox enzyme family protein [Thermomonosporaceae]MDL4775358.1 iron-containing redox enzyme family protein [Actinomadura xylanilytica]
MSAQQTLATSYLGPVRELAAAVHRSPALDNDFYRLWASAPLPYPQVETFAREFYARTVNTSVMVALSVLHTDDLAARVECVKNLYSEYGNGDPAKAHLLLLERFLTDLLTRLRGAPFTVDELRAAEPLASTRAFGKGQRALFTDSDQRVVQGALLGQEHLAYSMLVRLYEGVRNYKHLYGEDEFHEECEYFYVHIGEAEKEHKAEAIVSAAAVCHGDDDLDRVREGFDGFLGLTADYWTGVHEAMLAAR